MSFSAEGSTKQVEDFIHMALIAPNTYRLSAVGTIGGRAYANVFHVQPSGSGTPDVDSAAQFLVEAYTEHFLPNMCNDVSFSGVNYVDLSSLSGDSGSIGWGTTNAGALGTAALPPQVSCLLHWDAIGTRQQRNGRTYLGAQPSANVFETGLLASTWVTQLETAAEGFRDELEADGLILSVLSVQGDNGTPRAVTGVRCDPRVATQRRRNRA